MFPGVDWGYFERFTTANYTDEGGYLPIEGEGHNAAQQCVTAVSKIVYEWYNNDGVFDNSHAMKNTCNDVSSYANWLLYNAPGTKNILMKIRDVDSGASYEREILKPLADRCLDINYLKALERSPNIGSIYDFPGPFKVDLYATWDEDFYNDYDDEEEYDDDDEESFNTKPIVGKPSKPKTTVKKASSKKAVSKPRRR